MPKPEPLRTLPERAFRTRARLVAVLLCGVCFAGLAARLFCLQFSFIGWSILCTLTLGLGNLALRPYEMAAIAAFYREISGGTVPEDEEYSA